MTVTPIRNLTRLPITGSLSDYTPLCVLLEIASAHGIRYNLSDCNKPNYNKYLIESIRTTPIIKLSNVKDAQDWQYLARFVNKDVTWRPNKLIEAYNFLISFSHKDDLLKKLPENFIVGSQTPDNVNSINSCILYAICIHHRLHLNIYTTIQQMEYAVRMLLTDVDSLIRRVQIFTRRDATRKDLVNILLLSPHIISDPSPKTTKIVNFDTIPQSIVSYDLLKSVYTSLQDIKILQNKIEPTTEHGSIALAALNYSIDISRTVYPINEYFNLKLSGRIDFKPIDSWMNYWFNINPNLFDLSKNFNPNFPPEYYNTDNLLSLCAYEGFTDTEIAHTSPYELLQLNYVSKTFHIGKLFKTKSDKTSILLEDLIDVPNGELLSYGQIDSEVQLLTVSELIGLFESNQNFTNPFEKNSVFPLTTINKLKNILSSYIGNSPKQRLSDETIINRNRLLEIIKGIEIFNKANDEYTRQLIMIYRANKNNQEIILSLLTALLHLGLYMRGWKGKDHEYPLSKCPVDDEVMVSLNVTNAISNYENLRDTSGKIGIIINNLPLVRYRDNQYQVSVIDDDGRTIGQRINIVKDGEITGNISSCIRLSSNWICASAHKYIIALGKSSPFDITQMRDIS